MARFCGNCGAKMDNNAKVCGQCGTPIEGNIKTLPVRIVDPEKKKKSKKIFRLVVVLVLIMVAAATTINVVSKFTGYNGLLRKVIATYERYDIDTLISLSSDIYYYGKEDYVEEYFKNHVGTTLDLLESSVGHSYKFSYEINEIYQLSDRKISEILDNIEADYPDFDVSTIKDIAIADITVIASKGEKSSSKDVKITMTKESESWKVLYID